MSNQILSGKQIEEAVSRLDVGWTHIPGEGLIRVIETGGFAEGLGMIGRIGEAAEGLGYFPEVTLRPEEVSITTFDADNGGVTGRDIQLASKIDEMLAQDGKTD